MAELVDAHDSNSCT